jgi:NADPH:quinone reductase-like Zn-dependent oxidoreductase
MRTFVFRTRWSLGDLSLEERPIPRPGPHDLLVRIRAASLNYRDLVLARGEYGRFPLPRVPLSDGAGEVVAVGPAVRRFVCGDLVCPLYIPRWIDGPPSEETAMPRLGSDADGVLAEYVCLHEDAAVRAPAHLAPFEAATLPIAAVTAWRALFEAGPVGPGDRVAVQGSGGVSLFVVQLARAAGARVFSVLRGERRRAALAALGAEVIEGGEPGWGARLRRASGGGVDRFVDVVGGPALPEVIDATRMGGAVVLVGFVGGMTATLDLPAVIRRGVTLRAISGGSRAAFEALVPFLERHAIRPVVDRRFPFEAAAQAYEHLAAGRPLGKVVVDVAGSAS